MEGSDQSGSDAPAILPNKLGITDVEELSRIVAEKAEWRTLELGEQPILGNFDAQHLKQIHGYLFQDVYSWAGEFRAVWTSRGDSFGFAMPSQIEPELARVAVELQRERCLRETGQDEFIRRAAYYWSEWNAIHPHLDGNGRACREVLRTLALQAKYELAWAGLGKEEVSHGSAIAFTRGDTSALERILSGRIAPMPVLDKTQHEKALENEGWERHAVQLMRVDLKEGRSPEEITRTWSTWNPEKGSPDYFKRLVERAQLAAGRQEQPKRSHEVETPERPKHTR